MRIQCVAKVREKTGQSARDTVKSFIDEKIKTVSVVGRQPEQSQGLFSRIGIETTESLTLSGTPKPFRILYSCFWNDKADMVVITTSGTPEDQWENYTSVLDAMAGLELLGEKSFAQDSKTP